MKFDTCCITSLPIEVIKVIFGYLHVRDLSAMKLVSQYFQDMVTFCAPWKDFCQALQHESVKDEKVHPGKYEKRFIKMYKRMMKPKKCLRFQRIKPEGGPEINMLTVTRIKLFLSPEFQVHVHDLFRAVFNITALLSMSCKR